MRLVTFHTSSVHRVWELYACGGRTELVSAFFSFDAFKLFDEFIAEEVGLGVLIPA